MFAAPLPAWTPAPTSLPAKPIDRASNTAIGMAYPVALVRARSKNAGSEINCITASSSCISTPDDLISSEMIEAKVVPNVTAPAAAAPPAGELTAEPPMNVASDGIETTADSPTTVSVAIGFAAIARKLSTKPSASLISRSPSCMSCGACGIIRSSSAMRRMNAVLSVMPSWLPRTDMPSARRPKPRLYQVFS